MTKNNISIDFLEHKKRLIKNHYKTQKYIKFLIFLAITLILGHFMYNQLFLQNKVAKITHKDSNATFYIAANKASFIGLNQDLLKYSINAESAIKINEEMTILKGINGHHDMKADKGFIKWYADEAKLYSSDKNVVLSGSPEISYFGDYKLNANSITLNYDKCIAYGEGEVKLGMQQAEIYANKFEALENYKEVKFYGSRVITKIKKDKRVQNGEKK